MTERRIRIAQTEELEPEQLAELTALCEAAFEESFASAWEQIIGEEYTLGALGTGSNAFYERLDWETWAGPTSVRMPDGERVRSADQDGHVMVLRTLRTPDDLRLDEPISVDWRPGGPW